MVTLVPGKKFDCDLRRSFDLNFLLASFFVINFKFNSNKSLEILLLFKNLKVVLKHFESLYMNGSNFSSSQHKV